MFSVCGRSAIIKGGKDIKENDINQDLYIPQETTTEQNINRIRNKEFHQKILEILSDPLENIRSKFVIRSPQQSFQQNNVHNNQAFDNLQSNLNSSSNSDIFITQKQQQLNNENFLISDANYFKQKIQNNVAENAMNQSHSLLNNNYTLSTAGGQSGISVSQYKPQELNGQNTTAEVQSILKSNVYGNAGSTSSEFYSQRLNNLQQGVSRVHFQSDIEELNSQSNLNQDENPARIQLQQQNNFITQQNNSQPNSQASQNSQSDLFSSQVQDISSNMEQLQRNLDQQRIINGKNLLHYAKPNIEQENQQQQYNSIQQIMNATPQTAIQNSQQVPNQPSYQQTKYSNQCISQSIDTSVPPTIEHMSGSQIGNFVLQSNDSFQSVIPQNVNYEKQVISKQNILSQQVPVQNSNPIPQKTFVNQDIQQQLKPVFMKQPQPFQPNDNFQYFNYNNNLPPVQQQNVFQQQENQIYSNQISNQLTEQLINSHISLVSPNQLYQQLPISNELQQQQINMTNPNYQIQQQQSSKYDIEIKELKNQVQTQQQLFQQQMQLIKLQQQKILEQQDRDENMKKEIDSLRSQLNKQQSEMITQHKYVDQKNNQIQNKINKTYKNAKLSLTNNSLVGFRGQEKLFDVNLSQKNIIQFSPENNSIIINLASGSISIKMDNSDVYQKWFNDINQCIVNAKSHTNTGNGLTMRLDDIEQKLYVYKSSASLPSKIFNIDSCSVFVTIEGETGSIKVKCRDGKKFSFTDKLTVIDSWVAKFQRCNGNVQYL